jgi:RNA polymerase sigma-70 factor, ECF subfamily
MSHARDPDHAAFDHLYRTTRADLLAYLLRRAPSTDDASEVLSETYLVAWRRLEAIPPGDKARLWLFGVARNLLLKHASRLRARNALVSRITEELRASSTRLPDRDASPDADHLAAALASLSELDREIITLTAWEGLTPKQIAVATDSTANAVRIRLHRARSRLQTQLAKDHVPHGPTTTYAR